MNEFTRTKTREKKPSDQIISEKLIETIRKRLHDGKQVRRSLIEKGRLHIDRTLPFLIVYRRPTQYSDYGTERLVKGEASYLVASGKQRIHKSLSNLVKMITQTLSEKCDGFVIIEIWARDDTLTLNEYDPGLSKPSFRLITSAEQPPTNTIEALEEALKTIRFNKKFATVKILYDKRRAPRRLKPLLSRALTQQLNCFVIGLEVDPIYRHPVTGEVFPLVLRRLHNGFARALKKAVFEFSHNQTNLRPISYQALGRRATVKAVWQVDAKLADISSHYDFLLLLTPVNTESAFVKFKKDHFSKNPTFYYRPRPVDPSFLKHELFDIHMDKIEDPALASLFHEKRKEIDRQLSMLSDRNTKSFLYGSMQLYGAVSDDLLQLAKEMLDLMPPHSREKKNQKILDAKAFAEYAQSEIEYYRKINPRITSTVQIRNDIVGLMVSRGNLLLSSKVSIPASRCDALLQHEIGTHVLTYFNGLAQPLKLLYCGLTGYEELQEGLAVLSEYLVGGLDKARLRLLAGRVIAAHRMADGASFIETFRTLNKDYGFPQRTSFIITTRVFRGGGLTKDIVYLRGLVNLLAFLKSNNEMAPLFVGKIAENHIPLMKELHMRKVLNPIPAHPRYLDKEETKSKLLKIRNGVTVLNLIGGTDI